jgi:hypothetical protein
MERMYYVFMNRFEMKVNADDINSCKGTKKLSEGYPKNYYIEVNQFFDFENSCALTSTPTLFNIFNNDDYLNCMTALDTNAEFAKMDTNSDKSVTLAEA